MEIYQEEPEDDLGAVQENLDADIDDNDGKDDQGQEEPILDQHRQPRRGDIVSFREGGEHGHWVEARITSACTGRHRYYYNAVTDTGEKLGVWLKPIHITDSGHQEAWHLGPRLEFMRSPAKPPSRRVSLESLVREEPVETASIFDLSTPELIQLVLGSTSWSDQEGDRR